MEATAATGRLEWGDGRRDDFSYFYFLCYVLQGRCQGLGPRGVEHDADGGSLGLGGEIVAEGSADDASVAVGLGNAAPDDADLSALDDLLGAVDIGDTLAEVVVGILAVLHALNADEGPLLLLVVVAPDNEKTSEIAFNLKFRNDNRRAKIRGNFVQPETSKSTVKQ